MRIEFTDNTAVWDFSDRKLATGRGAVAVRDLVAGDTVWFYRGGERTVRRVVGDADYEAEGGSWEPTGTGDIAARAEFSGHPYLGEVYHGESLEKGSHGYL